MHRFFMLGSSVRMALGQIRRAPLRSFLTALGILIGVAAVIALGTLGEGAQRKITSEVSEMGSALLTVMPGTFRRGPTSSAAKPFQLGDASRIAAEIRAVDLVAPTSSSGGLAIFGGTNWNTEVTGTTTSYFKIRNLAVDEGRTFTLAEERAGALVCVLGATVKRQLFGERSTTRQVVRIGRVSCPVIGVLGAKGSSSFGLDQDDVIVMPLRAFQRRISGSSDVGSIVVSARSEQDIELAKTQIEKLLRQRRHIAPGQEDDFQVRDAKEIAQTLGNITQALTVLLSAVAAVSLIVGGIGIMNIMVVSVTERTREIGIRLAIGAERRDVLLQFLVEATVLSALGGILGVLVGLGASLGLAKLLGLPFVFVPGPVLLAFGFSATVGIVFGYLPARNAARSSPMDALRHE